MALTFKTMEEFLAAMKARIRENPNVSDLDTSEGSFADGILRAAAWELAAASFEQQALLSALFPDETSGQYIDAHARDVGIERKPGACAVAEVTFAGTDGTIVPGRTAVQTQSGFVFLTDTDAVIEAGTAKVSVTAINAGSKYNVAENAIVCLQSRGRVTVAASTAASGGTDPETDAALLARVKAFRKEAPASGNAAQYRAWAMEVPGVGAARVIERWNGLATVKVVVADSNMQSVDEDLVGKVQKHLESLREVCVDVTAASAEIVEIEVAAAVITAEGTSAASVETSFRASLKTYLRSLALTGGSVTYHKVAALLLAVPGVEDIEELYLNEDTENINLAEDAVVMLTEVHVE